MSPLPPHTHGPNEMPMLARSDRHHCQRTPKCYRCHSPSHLVSVCPKGRKRHPTAKPPAKRARTNSVEEGEWVEAPSAFQQATQNESMMLMEHIGLLERTEWTPEVCAKCFKQNPCHTELECPLYERCDCCGGSGPYGYKRHHTCYPCPMDDEVNLVDYDNTNYDLYWANDNNYSF